LHLLFKEPIIPPTLIQTIEARIITSAEIRSPHPRRSNVTHPWIEDLIAQDPLKSDPVPVLLLNVATRQHYQTYIPVIDEIILETNDTRTSGRRFHRTRLATLRDISATDFVRLVHEEPQHAQDTILRGATLRRGRNDAHNQAELILANPFSRKAAESFCLM